MDLIKKKQVVFVVIILLLGVSLSSFLFLFGASITGDASGSFSFCLNRVPFIQNISNQTAFVGVPFNFSVNATDVDGLFYRDNTSLFIISNNTGLINFTPSADQIGTHVISINVTDNSSCRPATSFDQLVLTIESIGEVASPILEAWVGSNNQDVVLNWTNVTDAESYRVYYSENLTAILNLNTSNIPSDVKNTSSIFILNYTDALAISNASKYYRVAAFNQGVLNLSLETAGKLDIPLLPGFNLISSPFSLKFNNLSAYDPLRTIPLNSIDTIYNYDFQKIDRLANQWWPSSNANFDLIEEGKGYFVFANQVSNLTFAGLVLNTFTVPISSGFNLLAWFDAFETLIGDESISKPINTSVTGCVDSIYEFDSLTKTFEKTDYISGYGFWSATNSNIPTLKPGNAYWFNANTNCNWNK